MNAQSHFVVVANCFTQTPFGGRVGLTVAMAAQSSDKNGRHTLMRVATCDARPASVRRIAFVV